MELIRDYIGLTVFEPEQIALEEAQEYELMERLSILYSIKPKIELQPIVIQPKGPESRR